MNTKLLNTFAAAIAVLLTLLGAASARAGNIFVVPLPPTNTDIATGITTNKTYVSCFNYGNRNNTIYSVNGVPFAHPDFSAANNTIYYTNFVDPASGVWLSGGQILGGSVFLSTITNSAQNIGHIDQTSSTPPGTPGPQSDGNTLNLLYDQIYPGNGQTAYDWVQEVYSNLVAGDNYSLRIYWRVQSPGDTNRDVDFSFNGEASGPQEYASNPLSLDTNVVTGFSGAEYIEYDFTAAGTTVSMLMTNINGGSTTFFSTLENDSIPYAPFITYNPSIANLGNGQYQFSAQAIGSPTVSYQWYTNSVDSYSGAVATADGADYSGSLSNILTTTSLTPTSDLLNYYFLVVSSTYGSATSSIVQINPLPVILAQPSTTNVANSYVQYNAVASTGFPPLTYQWYVSTNNGYTNGIATTDGNGYLGSVTTNLEATTNLQDYYFIVATDPYGSVTSSITAYNPLPTVSKPVASEVGNSVQLTVTASGWPTLAYQWYFNTASNYSGASVSTDGNGVSGSTTSSLTITNASDYYFVVVTNYYGSVTSSIVAPAVQLVVTSAGEPIWNQTNQIVVSFSDIVDPVTSTTITNYALNNSASVLSASLVGASNEVVLTTTPLSGSYTLTVHNVKDASFGVEMSPSPTNLTVGLYPANLALWVRANAANVTLDPGTNTVNQWNDMSGNQNNLYGFESTTAAPYDPVLATNAWGDTVIRFAASNAATLYAVPSSSLDITSGNMTIVAVVNFATLSGAGSSGVGTNGEIFNCTGNNVGANLTIPAPYDYYVGAADPALFRGNGGSSGDGNSYGQYTATKGPSVGVPHVLAVTESYNLVTHYLDGAVLGSGVLNGNFNVTNIAFGGNSTYVGWRADGSTALSGDLAELIVAGSAISAYDLSQLTSYLAQEHNISFVNQTPTNIVYSASSGNLTLSWPMDHTGWQLQAQTNSLSVGLGTNWVNVSGSSTTNQVIIPLSLTNGSVFYRLMY